MTELIRTVDKNSSVEDCRFQEGQQELPLIAYPLSQDA